MVDGRRLPSQVLAHCGARGSSWAVVPGVSHKKGDSGAMAVTESLSEASAPGSDLDEHGATVRLSIPNMAFPNGDRVS